ncbi:fused MFS/spermidine synthase [Paenibacillus sp. RC67]|uniref:spermidine synthase n=1 Tax=Paenibacillus sp. RC67 TaxID=3039392 RepID=UPI0024AE5CB1|nr:fused MFS/spermidine synthase [Paenibacillus sp. RC67]
MHLLSKEISDLNEISIYETTQLYGIKGKFRCLQFSDHAVQGAMDMKNPSRIVLEYPRAIIHLMEVNNVSFNKVFVIGHGIGTIAGNYPEKLFTIAEIDDLVVECSRRYFGYRYNNVIIGDGRQLLELQESNAWDYIILDAFTPKGTPIHLITADFFTLVMGKLTSRGALILNLMGKAKNDRLLSAIHTTLKESVPYIKAFVLPGEDEAEINNIILMGSKRNIEFKLSEMAGFQEIELEEGHVIMDSFSR